ncbi:hypothetical protein [Nocardiopsis sp. FIRDI 009]|uniref:hypothetical protein n=1 Tax=Nocardiopsis sp. FIRDI 009 TaxID=714197 RepID=UPI00351548E7
MAAQCHEGQLIAPGEDLAGGPDAAPTVGRSRPVSSASSSRLGLSRVAPPAWAAFASGSPEASRASGTP